MGNEAAQLQTGTAHGRHQRTELTLLEWLRDAPGEGTAGSNMLD